MEITLNNSKQIMDAYMPLLRANARQFGVFEYDEAMDESRMILIDAIESYDEGKGSFGNYLKNLLRYHFLDKAKTLSTISLDSKDENGDPIVENISDDNDFIEDILKKESFQDLYKALDTIDEVDRKIIYMKYWLCMTNKDIAEFLGKNSKTIANRHSLILKKLRLYLEKHK